MSNKKVRMAIQRMEMVNAANSKANKVYNAYKKHESLLLNFQMVRAYYGDNGASITSLVKKILKEKYNLPWQDKIIRKATEEIRGKHDAVVSIPQFKYEKKVYDILSEHVKRKFSSMIMGIDEWDNNYPLIFKELVGKYS